MEKAVRDILKENEKRQAAMNEPFNPTTGEGSVGERFRFRLKGFAIEEQWLPVEMKQEPLIEELSKAKDFNTYIAKNMKGDYKAPELLTRILIKLRSKYDFPFWCYMFVKIKPKDGGEDIAFKLNRPQRKLIEKLEKMRKAGRSINLILLKARQWGGSTCVQMYMAWIQLVHMKSWNSIVASHTNTVSATVRGMYTKMLEQYPTWMLWPETEEHDENEEKITAYEGQQSIKYIPSRLCKIRIATANAQENLRSEDVALVHMTEVALWPDTIERHPEDYVSAFTSGMATGKNAMKIMESTAKGVGNYFHIEWLDAVAGRSDSDWLFIGWQEIERDQIPFNSKEEKEEFAKWLYDNKDQKEAPDLRSEAGSYLWMLWETTNPTLEGLNWYVQDRKGKTSHEHQASEAPSFWQEAFTATGEELFDSDIVNEMRKTCRPPKFRGEVQGAGAKGKQALEDVKFCEDKRGEFCVWQKPEPEEDNEKILNRYLVVVDIGGTHHAADWSVIAVFDRYWMIEGGKPSVVAQWRGHIAHDLLAWKSAQIAKYYNDAKLVIESNSLDKERDVNADVSEFILNRVKSVYDNLYERERSEEDIKNMKPVKYGWHTNVKTKPKIVKQLQECVRDKMYIERDEECLNELMTYEHNGQKYEAKQGFHDDMLMTRAIGLWICFNEMDKVKIIDFNKTERNEIRTEYSMM